ncbi:hypothetical protein QEN19_000883 [Hanseniaspora menglaensis]
MFFDQQALLQQQLDIEDKISEEKENNIKELKPKRQSPTKSNADGFNISPKKNMSASKKIFANNELEMKKLTNFSQSTKTIKFQHDIEPSNYLAADTSVLKQIGSENTNKVAITRINNLSSDTFLQNGVVSTRIKETQIEKPTIKKENSVLNVSRNSKKRKAIEEKQRQKDIQEERRRKFQKQIELENLKLLQHKSPIKTVNFKSSESTDEYATDDEEDDDARQEQGIDKEDDIEEIKGEFSTEDEEEECEENEKKFASEVFYKKKEIHSSVRVPSTSLLQMPVKQSFNNFGLVKKSSNILQTDSIEIECDEEVKLRKNIPSKEPSSNLQQQKENFTSGIIDKYKSTVQRQKLAIYNKTTNDVIAELTPITKTPANKNTSKPDQPELVNVAVEKKKLLFQNSDSSCIKKDENEVGGISLDNKKPKFKIPKVNLLNTVTLKRTNDGPLEPPNLKRTRSIDGAKLRSITNIIPLQQQTLEIDEKKPSKIDLQIAQLKSEQINLLNSVALAKKEKMQQKKLLGNKHIISTSAALAGVTPLTCANSNSVSNATGVNTSDSSDSEKWKNSWRAVMSESKLITIFRDPEIAMNGDEERLLSVVQAGFRSLGANLTANLDSKTFILVTVGDLSESKSFGNVLRVAERMNCKIWNMQKAKRFFKHLDIKVDEMEVEYDTMRFIDYAKYTIPVNYKLLEQTKQQQPQTAQTKISQTSQQNNVVVNASTSANASNTNGGKLIEYLNMESKYGHLDRDTAAKREDHHYFAEEKPHFYIYFANQQFAPVVSMEWKCPTTKEDVLKEQNDVDSLPYPSIKYSYNGRSPFAKRDKEEVSYQKIYELNRIRTSAEMEECLHNGHDISPNLVRQRYEKDLIKEDYGLLLKRLYSQTSVPKPDNDIYFFDKYYETKKKKWLPYNNTLLKANYEIYDEKRNASILNAHQADIEVQNQANISANGTTAVSQNQAMKAITSPPNEMATNHEDTLTNQTQKGNKEMRASGVFIPTNTGTGTGNGLAPVKATVISTQMKLLQKRQIQQQRKIANGMSRSGYCEGCRMKYEVLDKHISSERHRSYAANKENFAGIDNLIQRLSSSVN